jgi:siroheme synthase (precorrin-2 oxidase/ferrochelatase)
VKVSGHNLKYYKSPDTEELGNANLVTTDFIRPFDDTVDCTVFEMQDGDRVFAFQCGSNKEMIHWINTLEKVKGSALTKIEEEVQKKIIEDTPEKIRWFDELGEEKFVFNVGIDLDESYPDPQTVLEETQEPMTIKEHLECAADIVSYLQSFVPDVQKCETRPARYDILAVMLTIVNAFLYERMSYFLTVSSVVGSDNVLTSEEDDGKDQNRSDLIENATLGDLLAVINFISKYQNTIKNIRCPVFNSKDASASSSAVSSQAILSSTYLSPKSSRLFELLPDVCKLYVYGGSKGSKGGAAAHLYDHCIRVWELVIKTPEEMLQQNNDGSFYTHSPVDMWEAINQHISLATSTNSPILHVMIADKVVSTLNSVFDIIVNYVHTLDTSTKPAIKEIELEFISALANDTALHIEEVMELIENFTIAEIREKIDEIFTPLITNLVKCGETCLKRLANLVMSDVQGLLDEVFMEEWLEGKQMQSVTATISDYMNDFEKYLVKFWAEKFVYILLEEITINYTRSLLFSKKRPAARTVTTTVTREEPAEQTQQKTGFFSSIFKKTAQTITKTMTITKTVPSHVPVDEESLGRLAQDVNILNAFFSKKAGQETAMEFLCYLNEISLFMVLDRLGLLKHFATVVAEYPSAAQSIYEVIIAVMKMRAEEFVKADFEDFTVRTLPLIQSAPEAAKEKDAEGIAEGRLGLLYNEVVPKELLKPNNSQKISIAQRMKMMSNLPTFVKGAINKTRSGEIDEDNEDDDEDGEDGEETPQNRLKRMASEERGKANTQLLDDVLEVLQQQEMANENAIQEEEFLRQEEEMARKKVGLLAYDGYLEKKSPAHNLWQVKKSYIFCSVCVLSLPVFFLFYSTSLRNVISS